GRDRTQAALDQRIDLEIVSGAARRIDPRVTLGPAHVVTLARASAPIRRVRGALRAAEQTGEAADEGCGLKSRAHAQTLSRLGYDARVRTGRAHDATDDSSTADRRARWFASCVRRR